MDLNGRPTRNLVEASLRSAQVAIAVANKKPDDSELQSLSLAVQQLAMVVCVSLNGFPVEFQKSRVYDLLQERLPAEYREMLFLSEFDDEPGP